MDKGYYAIIPASVRYDTNISANAKLLYGEITALCNEKGYCWATNEYFADLYDTSNRTIQRWLTDLKNAGYIYTEDESTSRKIRIVTDDKNVTPPVTEMSQGDDKNVTQNNTENITESNTYFDNDRLNKAFAEYVTYKDEIGKPMTAIGIEKEKDKLIKLANTDIETAIAIIEQTITKSWATLYPLSKTKKPVKNFTEREYDWETLEDKLFNRKETL